MSLNNSFKFSIKKSTHLNLALKLIKHLSEKRKLQLILVIFIMLLSALSEVLIVVSVIPFLLVLSDPEKLFDNKFINLICNSLGIYNYENAIFPITIIFIISAFLVGFVRLLNLKFNLDFAAIIGNEISMKTYKKILFDSYENHIMRNSSEVLSTLVKHIDLTVVVINHFLIIVTSSFITIGLLIVLIYISGPVAVSAAFLFGLCYLLIAFFSADKVSENSKILALNVQKMVLVTQESLGGIKDIIMGNFYYRYLDSFEKSDKKVRNINAENTFIAGFPRFSIESVGLIFLGLITLLFQRYKADQEMIIPIIGSIGLGAQRLLPALQSLYFAWSASKARFASVNEVLKILDSKIINKRYLATKKMKQTIKEICFKDISFKYKGSESFVLKNLNLKIKKGERIGIVGETGSGKSTLIDILMGLIKPSEGKLIVDNYDLTTLNNEKDLCLWRNTISYVPQNIFLLDASISENIAFGIQKNKIDYKKVKLASDKAQLTNFVNELEDGFNTKVGEQGLKLSGGQRQRIAIARSLYKDSQIIILDEATSALDQKTEKLVMDSIKSLNEDLTIIVIAHRLTTLRFCNKLYEVKNKKIIEYENPSIYLKKMDNK